MPNKPNSKKHFNTNPIAEYITSVGEEILERLEYIKFKPKRILDLGAGNCAHSEQLNKRFSNAQVFALDQDFSALSSFTPKGLFRKKVQRVAGCVTQLPLATNSVDMVFCNMVLHQTDLPNSLKEIFRVLAPEGLLMLSLPGPDTFIELRQTMQLIDDCAHVHVFPDMHDVGDQLLKLGFKDPVMDTEHATLHFESMDHLFDSLTQSNERNHHPERTKHLIGKHRWEQMKQNHPENFPATIETNFAHAWGNERLQHTDEMGTTFVSLDSLRKTL